MSQHVNVKVSIGGKGKRKNRRKSRARPRKSALEEQTMMQNLVSSRMMFQQHNSDNSSQFIRRQAIENQIETGPQVTPPRPGIPAPTVTNPTQTTPSMMSASSQPQPKSQPQSNS